MNIIIVLSVSLFVCVVFIGFLIQTFNKRDKAFWKPFLRLLNWLTFLTIPVAIKIAFDGEASSLLYLSIVMFVCYALLYWSKILNPFEVVCSAVIYVLLTYGLYVFLYIYIGAAGQVGAGH